MLRTLVWKESRELAPMVLLALVVQLLVLGVATGLRLMPDFGWTGGIPFVDDTKCYWMLLVAGAAAAWIGLRQTARESSRGTYLFLLHRPASREAIFGTKLIAGLFAYAIFAGLPLGLYTLWAATPGTHASPFYWSLAAWAWLIFLRLPIVYLGGFLSGLRPGRWLGTRLLPLAGSFVLMFYSGSSWPWLAVVNVTVICAVLMLAIVHVAATRDYS